MGRIKTRFVKSSAKKIYDEGREDFSNDFDKNKTIVTKFAQFNSKKLRNVVVGFITRLTRRGEN